VRQNGHSTWRTLARLAFADHMDRLAASKCALGSPRRTETLAGAHPAFDGPVILLQDVIEILYGAVLAIVGQITCGLEPSNGVSGVLVGVDHSRGRMVLSAQRFDEKALGSRCIAFGREQKSQFSHRWSPRPGTSTPTCH
jgi:hypothetical protein